MPVTTFRRPGGNCPLLWPPGCPARPPATARRSPGSCPARATGPAGAGPKCRNGLFQPAGGLRGLHPHAGIPTSSESGSERAVDVRPVGVHVGRIAGPHLTLDLGQPVEAGRRRGRLEFRGGPVGHVGGAPVAAVLAPQQESLIGVARRFSIARRSAVARLVDRDAVRRRPGADRQELRRRSRRKPARRQPLVALPHQFARAGRGDRRA